jgi:hypothetical protein
MGGEFFVSGEACHDGDGANSVRARHSRRSDDRRLARHGCAVNHSRRRLGEREAGQCGARCSISAKAPKRR